MSEPGEARPVPAAVDMTRPIQLLTFDLDDTLWELGPVLLRAEQITWRWLQGRVPPLSVHYDIERLRELRQQLMQQQPALAHRVTQLRRVSVATALQRCGIGRNDAEAIAMEALEVFLEARHRVTLFDQTEAVLQELGQSYRLAAITNGNASIQRLGLDRYFAFCIQGEQLARAKPHPDPFEAALKQAQCSAASSIHIGDHCDHDICAAQAVGMHTIWVNRARLAWPGGRAPSAIISTIDQLPEAVATVARQTGTT